MVIKVSTKNKSIISLVIFASILVAGFFADGFNEEMTHNRIKEIPGQFGVQEYRVEAQTFGPREYLRVIQTRNWLNEEGELPE